MVTVKDDEGEVLQIISVLIELVDETVHAPEVCSHRPTQRRDAVIDGNACALSCHGWGLSSVNLTNQTVQWVVRTGMK